jgi:hyperosmotically inducible periplasmic protein
VLLSAIRGLHPNPSAADADDGFNRSKEPVVNIKSLTAFFVVAALLSPLATRAAEDGDKDRKHPGAFVKDSVITTKIKTKLAAQKMSSLAKIRVDTDSSGMVVLSGTARSQEAIDKATSIARGVEGVVSVQNNITVRKDD